MTTWPRKTIAECAAKVPYATQIGPFGKALTPEAYRPTGIPLLRGVNVNHGRFHDDDFVFIGNEDADRLAKFESFPGDVLLVHKGTLGQIGLMPHRRRFARYIMGNSMLRVRCDPDILLPEYLYYWLSSADGKNYLLSRVSQVGVPQIQQPLTTLREATLPVPSVSEQRAITSVLGSLDDKIEQNRRTARALERLARAIFRAWFVDFEPVKAKAAGAASFPSMPQSSFDALPTTFTDSELGPVPEGWQVKSATEVAQVAIGKTPPRKEPQWFSTKPTNVPWVSIADMGSSGVFVRRTSEYLTPEAIDRYSVRRIPSGSVLFSFKLTVGRLAIANGEITSNEAIAHFVPNRPDAIGSEYLFCYLAEYDHTQLGSTSSIATATNSKAVKAMPVLVPPENVSSAFTTFARPIFDCLCAALRENDQLGALRDFLLPKLVSGQVPLEVA